MNTKSPTTSVKSREMIGVDQFSQRREVFDKHDSVFLPLPSPTTVVPVYKDVEPIITSNHGKTTTNFKRNTAGYSSMRESKTDERHYDFRPRKYSDNFTSELNQSDDVDYRHSAMERTRRLSKLRREFLASNLHDTTDQPFTRTGTRASLPANSTTPIRYKIESPNIYKFPFAEPYATPTPVRKIRLDLGPTDVNKDGEKENEDPIEKSKYQSLPYNNNTTKIDHQKLFEELVKRYSPQRKPIDWTLPPTKPKVIASVPKSTSSVPDTIDSVQKLSDEKTNKDDDVFEKKDRVDNNSSTAEINLTEEIKENSQIVQNGPETGIKEENKEETKKVRDSNISLSESAEKNDRVPELPLVPVPTPLNKVPAKKVTQDENIPALLERMTTDGDKLENTAKTAKKVKRKRSFLDKLLGRKKDK